MKLTLFCISSSSSFFKVWYISATAGFMKNSKYPPNIFRWPSCQKAQKQKLTMKLLSIRTTKTRVQARPIEKKTHNVSFGDDTAKEDKSRVRDSCGIPQENGVHFYLLVEHQPRIWYFCFPCIYRIL